MSNSIKILTPSGILDQNKSLPLIDEVKESIAQGNTEIAINLQDVTFMDSSGLGNLILIRRIVVEEANGKLFLTSLSDQVKMLLFELTNTGQFFEILGSLEELESI